METDGQADRRTDMTKLIVALSNFTNAPKHSTWCSHYHMCFVNSIFISYIINRSFITELESVYCAVRTKSLHKTYYFSSLKG
jgi:hypothetical protein